MRAIILAAGEGSRLRPLTTDKPKPMIRVANKPIVQHAIEALVDQGVKDITLVVGYHREKVQAYFQDGRRYGAKISYAFQNVLSGTAPALLAAQRPDAPFLLLSGDNVVDASLIKAVLDAPGDGPVIAVHASADPSRYGVVDLEGERVVSIEEKPAQPRSRWVNTGVYRLAPSSYDRVKAGVAQGDSGLPDVLQRSLAEGVNVTAVKSDDLWVDAVYPWDLLRVQAEVFRHRRPPTAVVPHAHIEDGVLLGDDATVGAYTVIGKGTTIGNHVVVGPHCVLENCIVEDDAQIGAGSILKNTIIGAGAIIGPRFTATSGPCEARTVDGYHHLADFGSVVGQDARLEAGVTLAPGVIVGNRVRVALGKTLTTSVEDGAQVL